MRGLSGGVGVRLLVLAVCSAVGLVGSPAVALGEASSSGLGSDSSSSAGSPLVVQGVQSLDGSQQALNAEEALRSSPGAVALREESQTKYEGLSSEEASLVDGEAFPGVVNEPAGGPPKLPEGGQVVAFPSDYAMSVAGGSGGREVRETLEPVAFGATPGQRTPIDLGLFDAGGSFQPKTALAPVRIPKRLNEGASLSEAGVSLTPVDEQGAALAGEGVLDGASVFYGDSEDAGVGVVDLDTLVKPSTFGLMMETVLRSQRSPSRLFFKVGLPEGATLEQESPGSGVVTVVKGGSKLAMIFAPSAHDVEGVQIPVSMVIEGDTLVVTVDRSAGEYAYPITVDPRYEYYANEFTWDMQVENSGSHKTNWHFEHEGSLFTGSEVGGGQGWTIQVSGNHGEYERGWMAYTTQGLSHIWDFANKTAQHEGETRVESRVELDSENGVEGETALSNEVSEPVWNSPPYCRMSETCKVTPADHNSAAYVALASGAGTGKAGENVFRAAEVAVQQEVNPEVQFDTTDEKVGGYPNALYGTKTWLGPRSGALVKFTASDKGIGIEGWSTEHTNSSGAWEALSKKSLIDSCSGIQCPPETVEYIGYSSALSDGEPKLGLDAWNAEYDSHAKENEAEGLRRHTVKVDSTSPHSITLSGLTNGDEIGEREYTLKVEATDGSGTTPSSGVKSIAVSIDGHELGQPNGSCSEGPCTATGEWRLNGGEFGVGEHELVVTATDNAGNVATEHFTLKVHHASPVALGPGAVNPLTGELNLNSTDVSAAAPGTGLTVSRGYQSRHLTAGVEGPLGPQWTLSVGGQNSIVRTESNVTLDAAGGGQTTFTSNGKGGFTSPNGDANLELTEAKNGKGELTEYVLKNPADGTTTRFTSTTGPTGSLWKSTRQEGTLASQTVTYTYQTVEGITEPVEALAPPPAGVSCGSEVKTLKAGCRALEFKYATETNAGEGSGEWKEFKGRLIEVLLVAWNGTEMQKVPVAHYAYDAKGRLRAEWNPRISPALKTVYGYDGEGHVTALTPPGQESWVLTYGTISGDSNAGRLLKVTRAPVSSGLWNGKAPEYSEAPRLSGAPEPGVRMAVSTGTWTNSPIAYGYQWEDCNREGKECTPIPGATNPNYTPVESDLGHTLIAEVFAVNGGGSVIASTAASPRVGFAEEYALPSGSDPFGIAAGPDGNLWFTELAKDKIGKITTAGTVTEYSGAAFPTKIASGSDKNLWFTDEFTSKIGKITTSGTITEYSLPKESEPWGIAGGPDENLWFAETGTSKIGKITTSGTVTEYALPSGSQPVGITTGADKNLWFTDKKTNKIGKITTSGTVTEYALPSGSTPSGITSGSDGNLWFTESGSNKIGKITTAGTITEYVLPAGSEPEDITSGSDKNLWFTERKSNKLGKITTAGTVSETVLPAGTGPEGITSGPDEKIWFTGQTAATIGKIATNPGPPTEGEQRKPSPGATVEYRIPVSGSGAPYELGAKEVEAWGQKDDPTDATAIFSADEPQGWPASDYKRASITYLDEVDHVVNTASPSGAIATTEYNEFNDVVRTLSSDDRVAALKEGTKSAEVAKLLSAESKYNGETKAEKEKEEKETSSAPGSRLLESLGPQHAVRLAHGKSKENEEVQARDHTVYSYDEGEPTEGGPHRLVTKVTQGAQVNGEADRDVRTVTTSYSGQENLGWTLRRPTSVTTTSSTGVKLVHTSFYDPRTGNVTETRAPGASGSGVPIGAYVPIAQVTVGGPADGVAVDSTGHVWVADTGSSSVDELSATGELIDRFGIEGTESGQFKQPRGIAVDSEGHIWVADTGNNRVQELSSTGAFIRGFGSEGTETGKFKKPAAITIDSSGNVWVADTENNRIQEFSSSGTYLREAGNIISTEKPEGIVANAKGDVWVSDTGFPGVVEFSATGEDIGSIALGKKGSGNGELKEPAGLAISGEDLYVADRGNSRVQEFKLTVKEGKSSGEYVAQFGKSGSGNGQFKGPQDIALDKEGHVWVADAGNSRLQELHTTGEYVTQASTASSADGVAVDSSGHVWAVNTGGDCVEEFSATGEYLDQFGTEGTESGQFKQPRGIAVDSEGHIWVADTGNNRVQELSAKGEVIRVFGSEGKENGQFKKPVSLAFNAEGDVWVGDAGDFRTQEFSATGTFIRKFEVLGNQEGIAVDTKGHVWVAGSYNEIYEYSSTGIYISDFGGTGSGHGQFKIPSGIAISGENIFVVDRGNNRVQEFKITEKEGKATGEYITQFGTTGTGSGQLAGPEGVVLDKEGHVWIADAGNGRLQEFNENLAGSHASQTIYYSAGANSTYTACGEHPEWANLPCQTQPAKQPETSGLPKLPVTTVKYNIWDEPETTTATVGSSTRTTTMTYDEAGRLLTSETKSTEGKALPKVTNKYSETTGQLIEGVTGSGSEAKMIKSVYNTLGQLTSYTDANGGTATYEYEGEGSYKGEKELDGRLKFVDDGKGTQAYTYEEPTGMLSKLVDTQGTNALTFTATYDVEGNMTSESYPNGMTAKYTRTATGEATGLIYEKTTHCTEKCVWFTESVTPSIHDQTLEDVNSLATASYAYDEAGRLTEVRETPTGEYCKTRVYAYDEESDRTSLTTREPNSKKECATEGGTVEKHTYDEADRLTDTGLTYDNFGDIVKLPAADASGAELQSTYYANGRLDEQKQSEQTIGYQLDPAGRPAETIDTGTVASTYQTHYVGPTSSPSWTVEPTSGHWKRYVEGIGGMAAIETDTTEPVLQLTDLHGDIIATASTSETATKPLSTERPTEYGVPTTSKPPKYSWLGGDLLPTELSSGVVAMGARSYVPQIGRFLQPDPALGGTDNPYAYTDGNPVNETDLTGAYVENNYLGGIFVSQNQEAIEKEAAREQAAREAAERQAMEAAWAAAAAAKAATELAEAEARNAWDAEAAAGPTGPEGVPGEVLWESPDAGCTGTKACAAGGIFGFQIELDEPFGGVLQWWKKVEKGFELVKEALGVNGFFKENSTRCKVIGYATAAGSFFIPEVRLAKLVGVAVGFGVTYGC